MMNESFCGKNCAECVWKEPMTCPGCKKGPGRDDRSDCELAVCCRNGGLEACDACDFRDTCKTLKTRDLQPETRKRKAEEARKQASVVVNNLLLEGKWLKVLFWLIVPLLITGIIGNDKITGDLPRLCNAGKLLNSACYIVYGVILLILSPAEKHYRTAGICDIVSYTAVLLTQFITVAEDTPEWSLAITLPATIITLVGLYNEYTAHSGVLTDVDNLLSKQWIKLRDWTLGLEIGLLAADILVVIVPILGVIALLAVAIGLLVVSIKKLIYLFRTANTF